MDGEPSSNAVYMSNVDDEDGPVGTKKDTKKARKAKCHSLEMQSPPV